MALASQRHRLRLARTSVLKIGFLNGWSSMGLPDLRQWQVAALDAWLRGGRRGCFEVATGGGKTTFALACYLEARERMPTLRTLIVVPTTALLDQWFSTLTDD